jgi:hypothetical protein
MCYDKYNVTQKKEESVKLQIFIFWFIIFFSSCQRFYLGKQNKRVGIFFSFSMYLYKNYEELDKYSNQFAGFCFLSTATVNIINEEQKKQTLNKLTLFYL